MSYGEYGQRDKNRTAGGHSGKGQSQGEGPVAGGGLAPQEPRGQGGPAQGVRGWTGLRWLVGRPPGQARGPE